MNPASAAAFNFAAIPATAPIEPSGEIVPVIVTLGSRVCLLIAARVPTVKIAPAEGPSMGPVTEYLISTTFGSTPLNNVARVAAEAVAASHCGPAPLA
ncbi:unannotated protein [freshwater metagenome]|uniref:Unannotated protein n=1 Tax=freshwater metagenome TaxID=449393 RepID=A0A6J7G645_9ZZZZ